MTIQNILDHKGSRVITIAPHHTLYLALCTLAENKVGALLVQNGEGQLVGIITERDLMRAVYQDTDLRDTQVESLMTRSLVIGSPDQSIEYVMAEMTEGRFRHMPVMDEAKLVGIISIGDLVKAKLQHTEDELIQYKDYVALSWRSS
jgi:CBS domain-containing protein